MNFHNLHFLSNLIVQSWNFLICTLVYLYWRCYLGKESIWKVRLNICLKDICGIFMFLCTMLRVTQNKIAYLYYPSNDKDVNIEMYLRTTLLLVKIYLWIFSFGCVSFSREQFLLLSVFHQVNTILIHKASDFLVFHVRTVEVPYSRCVAVIIINTFLFCGIVQ